MADAVDWSQFTPVNAAPPSSAPAAVDWSQFSPITPDSERAAPVVNEALEVPHLNANGNAAPIPTRGDVASLQHDTAAMNFAANQAPDASLNSSSGSLYVAGSAPGGMLQQGNIDLSSRPVVHNKDGTYSTVRSITITTDDGKAILIPTVIGDSVVSDKDAIAHFQNTGQNLGVFSSEKTADAYAEQLHNQQARMYAAANLSGNFGPSIAADYQNQPQQNFDANFGQGTAEQFSSGKSLPQPDAPAPPPSAPEYGKGLIGYAIDNPLTRGLGQGAAGFIGGGANFVGNIGPVPQSANDWLQRNIVTPSVQREQELRAPDDASLLANGVQTGGNIIAQLDMAALTGGRSLGAETAVATDGGIMGATRAALTSPQARIAATLGTTQAGNEAAQLTASGQPVSRSQLLAMASLDTTANLIGLHGKLPWRIAKAAAVSEGANEGNNLLTGQPVGTGATESTLLGAGLGIIPGGRAPTLADANAAAGAQVRFDDRLNLLRDSVARQDFEERMNQAAQQGGGFIHPDIASQLAQSVADEHGTSVAQLLRAPKTPMDAGAVAADAALSEARQTVAATTPDIPAAPAEVAPIALDQSAGLESNGTGLESAAPQTVNQPAPSGVSVGAVEDALRKAGFSEEEIAAAKEDDLSSAPAILASPRRSQNTEPAPPSEPARAPTPTEPLTRFPSEKPVDLTAPNFGFLESHTVPEGDALLQSRAGDESPERQQLRSDLIDQRFAGHEPAPQGQQKIALVMGGGGGAGKGAVQKLLQKRGIVPPDAVHLDPDEFKTGNAGTGTAGVPEYRQIAAQGDTRAAAVTHLESDRLYQDALGRAIDGGYNLVLDRTMSNPAKARDEIAALKGAGYKVIHVGVTVPVHEALARASERSQMAPDARLVPAPDLIKAHANYSSNGHHVAFGMADDGYLFDNFVARGEEPRLIAESRNGKLDVKDHARYNAFVKKGRVNRNATTFGGLYGEARESVAEHGGLGPSIGESETGRVGGSRGRSGTRAQPAAERVHPGEARGIHGEVQENADATEGQEPLGGVGAPGAGEQRSPVPGEGLHAGSVQEDARVGLEPTQRPTEAPPEAKTPEALPITPPDGGVSVSGDEGAATRPPKNTFGPDEEEQINGMVARLRSGEMTRDQFEGRRQQLTDELRESKNPSYSENIQHRLAAFDEADRRLGASEPRQSRETEPATTPYTADDVRAAAVKGWGNRFIRKLENSGVLHFINTDEAIGRGLGTRDELHGVKGIYHDGHAYVVADHVKNLDAVPGIVVHEAGLHFGWDRLSTPEDRLVMRNRINRALVRGDADVVKAWKHAEKVGTPANALHEEAAAYLVENAPGNSIAQHVIDAVKRGLNRAGVPMNLLESDSKAIRHTARDMLRRAAKGEKPERIKVDEHGAEDWRASEIGGAPVFSRHSAVLDSPIGEDRGEAFQAPQDLPPRAPGESTTEWHARVIRENRVSMMDGLRNMVGLPVWNHEQKDQQSIGRAEMRAMWAHSQRGAEKASAAFHNAQRVFDKAGEKANLEAIQQWETKQHVTSAPHRIFFKAMQQAFQRRIDAIREISPGTLDNVIENYFPHLWEDPTKAAKWYQQQASKRPLEGNKSFLKQRVHETIKDGMTAGLKPVSTNPVDLVLAKMTQMDRFLALHQFRKDLHDRGWLKEMEAGARVPYGYGKVEDPAFMKAAGLQGYFAVPEPIARDINNYITPGLASKVPIFRQFRKLQNLIMMARLGWSAFHAGFTTLDNLVMHADVGVRYALEGDIKRALITWAKTPVSVVWSPIEGGKLNRQWLGLDKADVHTAALLDALEQGGARMKMDTSEYNQALRRFIRGFQQGDYATSAKSALGAVGEAGSWIIHHKLVPNQKMAARLLLAKSALDHYAGQLGKGRGDYAGIIEAMHPDALKQIMGDVVGNVDDRLGQMTYDNQFWSRTVREAAQSFIGAVGWQVGTVRTVTGGVRDLERLWNPKALVSALDKEGKNTDAHMGRISGRLTYLISLGVIMGAGNAALQYLLTGKGPDDPKDYFFPKTGHKNADGSDERLQLPTYWMDHFKLATHPLQTAEHKIHPIFGMVMEAISNQDYWGVQVHDPHAPWNEQAKQIAEFVAKGFMPYAASNQQKIAENEGGMGRQTASFFGITDAPASVTRTKFQTFVTHNGNKGFGHELRTQADAEHSKMINDLEDQIRNGGKPDLSGLSHRDLLRVERESKMEIPELRFKRMAIEDKLDGWDMAAPEERKRYSLREDILNSRWDTDRFKRLPEDQRDSIIKRIRAIRDAAD